MSATRLTVSVGGGGVGKTTTAAALALSMARRGKRCLVITVDPARRLADALGAEVGRLSRPVEICPRTEDRLFARMPDPGASLDDFVEWLFENPEQRERVKANPAYRELGNSLAGVHELITIGLLQTEVDSGVYDEIVLDTAPSRHALAFLTYPGRLLGLLEARALGWLASLAQSAENSPLHAPPKAGLFEWGRSKVEAIFGSMVGLDGLRNLSALFADMVSVRERWAGLARRTNQLLHNVRTRYFVIGAPTGGAMADVAYLASNLTRQGLHPSAIVLNRAEMAPPDCERVLSEALRENRHNLSAPYYEAITRVLSTIRKDHHARGVAAQRASDQVEAVAPAGTRIYRLPYVHRSDPRAIVLALADAWDELDVHDG